MRMHFVAVALTAVVPALSAQFAISPHFLGNPNAPATYALNFPFGGYKQMIYQQIHSDMKGVPLVVNRMAFDPVKTLEDGQARTVEFDLKIGESSYANRSSNFAANFSSPPTTVFLRKQLNLPDESQTLPRWSIAIAFDQSWPFSGQQELAWQITVFDNSAAYQTSAATYYLLRAASIPDAAYGTVTTTGAGCMQSGNYEYRLSSSIRSRWSTQTTDFGLTSTSNGPQSPQVLLLGTSNPAATVPGLCTQLLVGDVFLSLTWPYVGTPYFHQLIAPFPYMPALVGLGIYAQAAGLDPTRPGIPVSLSRGLKVTIPAAPEPLPFAWVGAEQTTTATYGLLWHDTFIAVEFRT